MYPEKAIFDVAGFPAIKGRELVEQLLAQAAPFNPDYLLGHQAVGLERGDGGFAVTTATGHRIEARAIVITGGIGTFTPRPLPTGGEYLGPRAGALRAGPGRLRRPGHRGRRRRRLGARLGADARADRAVGDVVHRRGEFRAHQHSVELLKASSVRIVTDAQVSGVRGDPDVERGRGHRQGRGRPA